MKSKKGKAPRLSPSGQESRGNVLARPRRAGARVTWWTSQPGGSRAETAAVLFVEAASEMAVTVFFLDTTRGAAVGRRASPCCWHVVKKHAHRLVCALPSFIVSADTPRSAEPPRGFSFFLARVGCGSESEGPAPRFFFVRPPGAPLSESWAPGPPLPPRGARSLSSLGMGCSHNRRNATLSPLPAPTIVLGCWKLRKTRL